MLSEAFWSILLWSSSRQTLSADEHYFLIEYSHEPVICGNYPRRASCMDVPLAYVANYVARTFYIPQWTFLSRCALYSIHSIQRLVRSDEFEKHECHLPTIICIPSHCQCLPLGSSSRSIFSTAELTASFGSSSAVLRQFFGMLKHFESCWSILKHSEAFYYDPVVVKDLVLMNITS